MSAWGPSDAPNGPSAAQQRQQAQRPMTVGSVVSASASNLGSAGGRRAGEWERGIEHGC